MIKRVVFVAGVTAGYLFGTPSGRRQLEKMKVWAVRRLARPARAGATCRSTRRRRPRSPRSRVPRVWEKAVDSAKSAMSSSTTKYPTDDASPTVVEPLMDADDANPGQR